MRFCERILPELKDIIAIKINKELFNLMKDLIFVAVYLSPEFSKTFEGDKNGIELLEEQLEKIVQMCPEVNIFLGGDFNARAGILEDFIKDDQTAYIPELEANESYIVDVFDMPRENMDKIENSYGRALISLCKNFNIHILNRRKTGDKEGAYTCIAQGGRSVVDYMLANSALFNTITKFEVKKRTESDYFPIIASIGYKPFSDEKDEGSTETIIDNNVPIV